VNLEGRLERLPSFGDEEGEWYKLRTFEDPESEETKKFWMQFPHYWGNGSGHKYLSGEFASCL